MRNQRKISGLLVHRMQREISLLIIVVLMITTLCVAFLIHLTLEEAIKQTDQGILSGGAIETLHVFKRLLLDRVFISFALGMFAIGWVVVTALHRISGPLNRISKTLHAVGEGHTPKEITLRQQDYFVELAQEVNRVIKRVEELQDHTRKGQK